MSRVSSSDGSYPLFSTIDAFTICPRISSGIPVTAQSSTASCERRALSTSKGPILYPELLITSSTRPLYQ